MSNLLNENCALAKLRTELERRKGKLCRGCKKFGHLTRNCRNKRGEEKGTVVPQNKFKVLSSRVMQCGVEEKTIRSMRMLGVKCFRCREEGHKYRECPLWEKKVKRVARPNGGKAHQEERRPARSIREKAQEGEKRLRRMKEEKAARPVNYFIQFAKFQNRIRWDDRALRKVVKDAIPNRIRDKLRFSHEDVSTFEGLKRAVMRIDNDFWKRQQEERHKFQAARAI